MGFGFWLFYPRTKTNAPLTEDEVTTNVILASEDITVYVQPVKMSGGLFEPQRSLYSVVFKAYLDNTFETPIWFYSDIVHYTSQAFQNPTETFIADKIYFSTDALNYALIGERYFDFHKEYNLFMPGTNGEVLSLKFNTFNGGIINLFRTYSYTPAHFGELFNNYIHEVFVENGFSKQTSKYDLLKYFLVYQKNEETNLYERISNKRLVFNVNFEKVDSLDEIITTIGYDYLLDKFAKEEITLTLNKQNATLTWNEIAGADKYVIRDLNNENFVYNSNTNFFDLSNVEADFWAFPNATKKLYVYGLKEVLDENAYYYENAKTLDSNAIEINFNYISNEYNGGTVYYHVDSDELRFDFSSVVGMDLLNKTYQVFINGNLVATTQNTYLSLDNLEFEQNLETGQNFVEVKCFSNDFKFASGTNDLYFLDSAGLVATCEFNILNDRFIGKPTNLLFNDQTGMLTWDGVSWAQNYSVFLNAVKLAELQPNILSFDLSPFMTDMRAGNNTISVFAMLNNWTVGAPGQDFVYNHYASIIYRNGDIEIPAINNIGSPYNSSDLLITIKAIDPDIADFYEVKIGDLILSENIIHAPAGTYQYFLNIKNFNKVINLEVGQHEVSVRAFANGEYSAWSSPVILEARALVTNIVFNSVEKTLTFDTVETAGYKFTFENTITGEKIYLYKQAIGNTSVDVDLSTLPAGFYVAKIELSGYGYDSFTGEPLYIEYSRFSNRYFVDPITYSFEVVPVQLPAPTAQIDFDAQTLNITPVTGAVAYGVNLNGHDAFYVENTMVELATYSLNNGTVIQVWAVGDGQTYVDSEGFELVLNYHKMSTPILSLNGTILTIEVDPLSIDTIISFYGSDFGKSEYITYEVGTTILTIDLINDFSLEFWSGFTLNDRILIDAYTDYKKGYYTISDFYGDYNEWPAFYLTWISELPKASTPTNLTFDPVSASFSFDIEVTGTYAIGVSFDDGVTWHDFDFGTATEIGRQTSRPDSFYGSPAIYAVRMLGDGVNYINSDYSTPIYVESMGQRLSTPDVTLDVNILSWTGDNVGEDYIIHIYYPGTHSIYRTMSVSEQSIDLLTLELPAGTYDVVVIARAYFIPQPHNYFNSGQSARITFQIS